MKTSSIIALGLASSAIAAELAPVPPASLEARADSKKANGTSGAGGSMGGNMGGSKGNSTKGGDKPKSGGGGANSTAPPVKAGAAPAASMLSGAGGMVTIAGLGIAFAVFM